MLPASAPLWGVDAMWQTPGMTEADPKADLHRYLRVAREAVLWKLDGLSEYDIRRPLTTTGTNLLGLIKHLTRSETRYFTEVFDRPAHEQIDPVVTQRHDLLPECGGDERRRLRLLHQRVETGR